MGITSQDDRTSPDIGKVIIDRHTNEKNNKEYIIIFPDPNQTTDHMEIAKNWIINNFEKKSKIRSGKVSFSKEEWKKTIGNEFIQAAHDSSQFITWKDVSNDAKIMKGLSILQGPGGADSPFLSKPPELGKKSPEGNFSPSSPDQKNMRMKEPPLSPSISEKPAADTKLIAKQRLNRKSGKDIPREHYLSDIKNFLNISEDLRL